MLIDIHVHIAPYSDDSYLGLEEAVIKAKSIGLDGLCVTDHESMGAIDLAASLSRKHNFFLLVGMEFLTHEGDLLVFGLDEVPSQKVHAKELLKEVSRQGGIAISAHPFRNNGRGMGRYIKELSGLHGIETFNGSTTYFGNLQAYHISKKVNLPGLGGSDAHSVERLGKFATRFPNGIRDLKDFIAAVKSGKVFPVYLDDLSGQYISPVSTLKAARRLSASLG